MTVRIMTASTSKGTDAIFDALCAASGGEVEMGLHLGKTTADFKASSLTRMSRRQGRKGHMMRDQRFTGAARALIQSPDFTARMEEFIDHLQRKGPTVSYESHALHSMQDYIDYYYILADVMAEHMVKNRVTHCVFINVPHLAYDTIAFQVARAMGIPTIIVTQSLFPGKFYSMRTPQDYGHVSGPAPEADPLPIEQGSSPDLFYMKGIQQERGETGRLTVLAVARMLVYLLLRRPGHALNPFFVGRLVRRMRDVYGQLPKRRDPFAKFFHENDLAYFEHIAQFEEKPVDLSGQYVYFPLQLQPEMTTSALGNGFHDQALAIERLAEMLPEGVRILVKENPKQRGYMRGPMFFHRLNRIPAVEFMPSYANTHALAENAAFVATITGTAGWEAVRKGKPALVFGNAWYASLPGVFRYSDDLKYEDVAESKFTHEALEQAAGRLLARAHDGIVDANYRKMIGELDPDANARDVAATMLKLLRGEERLSFERVGAAQEANDAPAPQSAAM